MNRTIDQLMQLSAGQKRAIIVAFDGVALGLALWLAFCLRYGEFYVPVNRWIVPLALGSIVLGLVALTLVGTYRVVIRYMEVHAATRIAVGAVAVAAVWFVLAYVSRVDSVPRSVGFIYLGLSFLLMFFGRLVAARLLNAGGGAVLTQSNPPAVPPKEVPVAIYGANAAGFAVAEALRRHPDYRLRCFVDDSPALLGRSISGCPIRSTANLRKRVAAGEIEQVFLAVESVGRAERIAAATALSGLGVPVMTIPTYEEIVSGRFTFSDVRPINVEDLLKRDIVPPLPNLIEQGLLGKAVLVTGAGGSIGSEICRQVFRHRPRRLVLLDHSEFALYNIESELLREAENLSSPPELVPVVGSLLDARLVRDLLARCEVDVVFHAAAYKHVPLLELNEVVGVTNNVIGTRVLVDACIAARVPHLTMISTDKAVRPTNVMGSSKRVAELYIQALAREPDVPTRLGIVRFGNVLDSSGSVVQRFRQQIEAGGPITVTHPDITRFFMSIPEATQLVLQANSLAENGEVFVLDMGDSVRITDLARTMIALSGMTEKTEAYPHGDIEVRIVGLRPGEKLHEELFIGDAVSETVHPQIKMAKERSMPLAELQPLLRRLEIALDAHDRKAVRALLRQILTLDFAPDAAAADARSTVEALGGSVG